jgi:peptidyl-tRNA hydrolase, PTH1 family
MELTLFVGLGNPGSQYTQTRHNAGFLAVDLLAKHWGLSWSEKKRLSGFCAEGSTATGRAVLLKPTTFMNNSGQSVRAAMDLYKLEASQILVLYDDIALPMGTIRLRPDGSAGGHNGIKSLIAHLGTQSFPRLRIGIDAKPKEMELQNYVLGKFSPEQSAALPEVLDDCLKAITLARKEGLEKAMSVFNAKKPEPVSEPKPKKASSSNEDNPTQQKI